MPENLQPDFHSPIRRRSYAFLSQADPLRGLDLRHIHLRRCLRAAYHGPNQHGLLWLHVCFFGLTWGARGPAITAKTADLFPGPGSILGVITIGTGLGAAFGSWLAGLLFDLAGIYRVAFILSIAVYACGAIAFWALRRPPALPRDR